MWHVIEHALLDTLALCPWLLLVYIVIELLENKTDLSSSSRLSGRLGPLVGAATGIIPQCGFSVMAAKLYEQKFITIGTLFAIFFSTSDEALILIATSGAEGAAYLLPLIAVKVLAGIAVGYGVDLVLRLLKRNQELAVKPIDEQPPKTVHEMFIQSVLAEENDDLECTSCGRTHDENKPFKTYVLSPILHTLQVALFVLIVNFIFGTIIHFVGEEAFKTFMQKNVFLQPFITAAIGLIPNCASSVVITETFLIGGISFGSLVGGLCANAGLGFIVLLKNTKAWKRNLALVGVSYGLSVIIGQLINLVMLAL